MNNHNLIILARKFAKKAYAPYSKFHVGAAILTKSGNIYTGCNIETYNPEGQTCAERNAVANMVSAGEITDDPFVIDKIAVTCIDVEVINSISDVSPCGACRQVISEFSDLNTKIIIDDKDKYPEYSIDNILPNGFKLSPNPDSFKNNIDINDSLENIAKLASNHAYVPISKNKIGAAILTNSGKVYFGSAVDNSSTGLYISAERSAIADAIINGEASGNNPKFIKEIFIYNEKNKNRYITSQNLISEFFIN